MRSFTVYGPFASNIQLGDVDVEIRKDLLNGPEDLVMIDEPIVFGHDTDRHRVLPLASRDPVHHVEKWIQSDLGAVD